MGKEYKANRVLSGSWAQIWVGGELWAECTGITARITETRSDVQQGMDINSKITGMRGEGTITVNHVYTTKTSLVKDKIKGKDTLVQIVAKLKDPDAVDGKTERWSFSDAVFTETPLFNWTNGSTATKEFPFQFPPSKMKQLNSIV